MASGRRPAFCRGNERKSPEPVQPSCQPHTPPLRPAKARTQNFLPSCSLPAHATARQGLPPPSTVPPRTSQVGGLGRSLRRGTDVHTPTRAACGSAKQGEPKKTERKLLRYFLLPFLPAGTSGASKASSSCFRPPISGPAAPSCGDMGKHRQGPAPRGDSLCPRHLKESSPRSACPIVGSGANSCSPACYLLPPPALGHVQYATN